jgi:hypothetical protein
MSANDQVAGVIGAGDTGERHALAFRIAIAASAGFTLGELLGWDFPFLPSLIAVQLLSARRSLDLKHAFGFVLLMAVGCTISLLVSLIFADRPLSLILIVGLMTFIEFLALARGQAAAGIFLMTTSFVPLMGVSSLDLAYALVHDLIIGSILALLLIFLILALFPQRTELEQGSAPVLESAPVTAALANTGVLMSLFVYFMGTGTPTSIIVIMVTAVTILQQSAVAGPGAAAGLIAGNIVGGLAATIAYLLLSLLPSPAFLLLVVLFFGLAFGAKIAAGGRLAPVAAVGTATFLVVLGLGLSPLPQDSGTLFLARISTVILASLYTIGILSVLRSLFSDQVSVTR